MFRRSALAVASLCVIAAVASGCSGEPAPVVSTSGFTSEEEAFAAAEETYRAYVDALNEVDLADPATFEPVFALMAGDAESDLRESFSQMHADGWSVAGESQVALLQPSSADDAGVALAVCLDVSTVMLTDSAGRSVVQPDRPDVQSMRVSLALESDWRVVAIEGRDGEPQCDE